MPARPFTYATRPIRPEAQALLAQLAPGQRLRITQTVRVGFKSWLAVIDGTYRHLDSLATGLATQRLPEDDIVVPVLHFTKPNGEMSSVTLDENTVIEAETEPGKSLTIRHIIPPMGAPTA